MLKKAFLLEICLFLFIFASSNNINIKDYGNYRKKEKIN